MSVALAERILRSKFEKEPFHNLYILNSIQPITNDYGGTCSDKALSYLTATQEAGFNTHLHSARIGGQEIHRLVRLEIDGRRYFADVGNGWPSLKLYPADEAIYYKYFGMSFRTEVTNGTLVVYHNKCGDEKLQMEIDIDCKSEVILRQRIAERFTSNIIYPFRDELRFSMVVGERFLFIRDTQLEIYSSDSCEIVVGINMDNHYNMIDRYFGYDIRPAFTVGI